MSEHFALLALGTTGGPFENNLTGYLLGPASRSHFIALDAGCLLTGLEKCFEKHPELVDPNVHSIKEFLQKKIRSYFISHPHLDHILGLVIASQVDSKKPIYGLTYTLEVLQKHIFNEFVWPDCISDKNTALYQLKSLEPKKATLLPEVEMEGTIYLLHHNIPHPSSACFFEYKGKCFLYFGDTFSDKYVKEKRLTAIWQKAATLIREGKLLAILLECSYPIKVQNAHIFGHLNVVALLDELLELKKIADLTGLNVIISHRKQPLDGSQDFFTIEKELKRSSLPVTWIFPKQGDYIKI